MVMRRELAGPFLERVAIGGDGLFEPSGAALAFPERRKRMSEVVLRDRPLERHALARVFLQRIAIGADGLFEAYRAALAFPQPLKRLPRLFFVIALGAARAPASFPPALR